MFMTLHILADHENVVGWQLVPNYIRTPSTHYYLESSGQSTYMETHPQCTLYAWKPSYVANPNYLFPSSSPRTKDVIGKSMGLKWLLFETILISCLVHATIQSYAITTRKNCDGINKELLIVVVVSIVLARSLINKGLLIGIC